MRRSDVTAVQAACLWALWGHAVSCVASTRGLFDWLGLDFALYSAGARLLISGHGAAVYDLARVARETAPYAAYYGDGADPLKVGPLPYPAPAFFLYVPFLPFRPPLAFVLWAVINFALGAYVVHALTRRLEGCSWPRVALILSFFPLVYTLFVGQPVVVLLFVFFRAYRGWEERRDFRAGLWCGILLLKVQYPLVLVLVLLYKGRWRSLAGFAVTGAVIAVTSLAAFGVRGVAAHLATIRSMSGFRSGHAIIYPQQMINWRGLLVNVLPADVSDPVCTALTLLLSGLTVSTLLVIWRGRWDPEGSAFPRRMLATLLVTLLVSFHSHTHGATLLLVPALALLAHGGAQGLLTNLLRLGLFAPTIVFALTFTPEFVAFLFIALMATALGTILVSELSMSREPSGIAAPLAA